MKKTAGNRSAWVMGAVLLAGVIGGCSDSISTDDATHEEHGGEHDGHGDHEGHDDDHK